MKTQSIKKHKPQPNNVKTKPASAPQPAAAPAWAGLKPPAWLPWAILGALALLAYLPALRAGFIWDDQAMSENSLVSTFSGIWRIWLTPGAMPQEQHYWPLVYSTFWLEHFLAGQHPFLYHLDNILLHGAVGILLWRVLRKLEVPGAWLAAAIFAVHPVHAESVAWVIERKDVLCGTLFMGSALAYLRFDETSDRTRWKHYGAALGLFLGALLSKSIVVGLPLALGIALWWRRGRLTRRDILALAPLGLLAAAVTVGDMIYLQCYAEKLGSGMAWPVRALMAGGAFWRYLLKLAWPYPLATFYPAWDIQVNSPLAWAPNVAAVGLVAGLWAARKKIGRGPVAAVAFFGLMVGPALGLVDYDFLRLSWIADRFQYLASVGPIVLAAAGLTLLSRKIQLEAGLARGGAAALLMLLTALTFQQTNLYRDTLTLFQASHERYPDCWAANHMLGWALMDNGQLQEAEERLKDALRSQPKPYFHTTHYLALTLTRLQRAEEAEQYYKETMRLKPDYATNYHNYGAFLASQGKLDEAVAQYREALRRRPNYPDSLNNLGNALTKQKKLDEAAQCLREAIRLEPKRTEFRNNLAALLARQGKPQEAMKEFEEALKIDPNLPVVHDSMGIILLGSQMAQEALQHFAKAVRLNPNEPNYQFHLGEALVQTKRSAEAIPYYQEALRLNPNHSQAADRLKQLGASPAAAQGNEGDAALRALIKR